MAKCIMLEDIEAVVGTLDHMLKMYPDPDPEEGHQLAVVGTADTVGFDDADVTEMESLCIERYDFGWRVRYASVGTISLRSPWVYGPTVAEAMAAMHAELK